MTALLRLLDLVRRDLGARDARAEIGGADPTDPNLVFTQHRGGFRVVAVFDEPPADPELAGARLAGLCESFGGVRAEVDVGIEVSIARRLDAELQELADRVGAACAFVVDRESPVIWGTSGKRHLDEGMDVVARLTDVLVRARRAGMDAESLASLVPETAERELSSRGVDLWSARFLARELERCRDTPDFRRELAASVALAHLRDTWTEEPMARILESAREGGFGVLARGFAGSYALVLAFDAAFSELHAEALMLRLLPFIERLVMALPPVEPPDKPGKVVRLRAKR